MQPNSFIEVVAAVDTLNSYVRSNAYRNGYNITSKLPKAIYQCKDWTIRLLSNYYTVQKRYLQMLVPCRHCRDGIFYDWESGEKRGECWTCNGHAKIRLNFSEYRFGEYCWHQPMRYVSEIPSYALFETETEWKPNLIGRDLTPDQVAISLNIVETYYYSDIEKDVRFGFPENERLFLYNLYVGDELQECSLCHAKPGDSSYYVSRNGISWHDYTCITCKNGWNEKWISERLSIFDQFSMPEYLCTDNIRAWQARHLLWETQYEGRANGK